jgi:hypothetical protein
LQFVFESFIIYPGVASNQRPLAQSFILIVAIQWSIKAQLRRRSVEVDR